jgi:hypothetical protein
VTIDGCEFSDGNYPAIGIAEKSRATITSVTILRHEWSSVVVRNGSTATITQSRIEGSRNFGIFASFADNVSVENTVLRDCDLGLVLVLDQAVVDVRKCQLLGRARTAVHCFTGGFLHIAHTLVAGDGQMVVVKLGGSVHFERVAFRTETVEVETSRPVKFERCRVIGGALFELVRNQEVERASSGERAVPPTCCACGGVADSVFIGCPHAQYCRSCWDALGEKPTNCPLCHVPVEGVKGLYGADQLCGICRERRCNGMVRICCHAMCSECGDAWFSNHADCPFCRAEPSYFRLFVSYS